MGVWVEGVVKSKMGVKIPIKRRRKVIEVACLASSVKVVDSSVILPIDSKFAAFIASEEEFLEFRRILDRDCVGPVIGGCSASFLRPYLHCPFCRFSLVAIFSKTRREVAEARQARWKTSTWVEYSLQLIWLFEFERGVRARAERDLDDASLKIQKNPEKRG